MVSIKKIDADLQFYYISSNIGVISHTLSRPYIIVLISAELGFYD